MAWVVWATAEIEADFLRYYAKEVRIMDKPYDTAGLSGPRFLNLAEQLPVYGGAVTAAARRWNAELEQEPETVGQLMLDPDVEVG